MEVEFVGLQRARTYGSGYEEPKAWETPACLLTFWLHNCRAPLPEIIDAVENLEGLRLDQCVRQDDRHIVAVETSGENWRPAVKMVSQALAGLRQPPAEERIEDLLHVNVLELELGYGLVKLVDTARGGDLLDRIAAVRRQIATELGILMPPVRSRDNLELPANDYRIKIREQAVARGEILPDHYLAVAGTDGAAPIPGAAPATDPATGRPAWWISPDQRRDAELLNYATFEPAAVLASHLLEVIRSHAAELLTRQETMNLVARLRSREPALVEEVIPARLRPADLHTILRNLLRQRLSVRDLGTILEAIGDPAGSTSDLNALTERARLALSPVRAL